MASQAEIGPMWKWTIWDSPDPPSQKRVSLHLAFTNDHDDNCFKKPPGEPPGPLSKLRKPAELETSQQSKIYQQVRQCLPNFSSFGNNCFGEGAEQKHFHYGQTHPPTMTPRKASASKMKHGSGCDVLFLFCTFPSQFI